MNSHFEGKCLAFIQDLNIGGASRCLKFVCNSFFFIDISQIPEKLAKFRIIKVGKDFKER